MKSIIFVASLFLLFFQTSIIYASPPIVEYEVIDNTSGEVLKGTNIQCYDDSYNIAWAFFNIGAQLSRSYCNEESIFKYKSYSIYLIEKSIKINPIDKDDEQDQRLTFLNYQYILLGDKRDSSINIKTFSENSTNIDKLRRELKDIPNKLARADDEAEYSEIINERKTIPLQIRQMTEQNKEMLDKAKSYYTEPNISFRKVDNSKPLIDPIPEFKHLSAD